VNAPQLGDLPITVGLIQSTQLDDGGTDLIAAGAGDDIVVSGFGGDVVASGDGSDVVIGDNGSIEYANAVVALLQTTDTVASTGGNDVIDTGNGDNIVFAGVGGDAVVTGDGDDTVLGDNGLIVTDAAGEIAIVVSGDPVLGGTDAISTGNGDDLAMGGAGNDAVLSADGRDVLFGDGGLVTYTGSILQEAIVSTDVIHGGSDVLDGGTGNDVLIGGQGLDLLYGSLSEDLLFGSNAAVTLLNGIATRIEADLHDLVTEAMFKLFNAIETGDEASGIPNVFDILPPGQLAAIRSALEIAAGDPLLDPAVIAELFDLGLTLPAGGGQAGVVFAAVFGNGVGSGSPPASVLRIPIGGDEPADAADGAPAQQGNPAEPPPANESQEASAAQTSTMASREAGDRAADSDPLVLALGMAGLTAVQAPRPHRHDGASRWGLRRRAHGRRGAGHGAGEPGARC